MHGMIPCGLVYLAAISALYYSSIQASMIHMFLFGIGTLPVLLFTSYTGNKLFSVFRIQRALPFIVFLAGIMMILRGAELGIPIISPVIADPSSVEICE